MPLGPFLSWMTRLMARLSTQYWPSIFSVFFCYRMDTGNIVPTGNVRAKADEMWRTMSRNEKPCSWRHGIEIPHQGGER